MKRSDIEIMAPAGSYESLHAAIDAGANSVYFGVGRLNMRAQSAANFTLEDMGQIVSIAREHGVKSYLTVNTVIYDEEIETLHATIDRACEVGVDAIIATDMAAIQYARSVGMAVHISTQSNISNIEAVRFFAQWADVVVLARELDLVQVARISREIERQRITGPGGELVRIEMFAHGALCMASWVGKMVAPGQNECPWMASSPTSRGMPRREAEARSMARPTLAPSTCRTAPEWRVSRKERSSLRASSIMIWPTFSSRVIRARRSAMRSPMGSRGSR
jgi:putative protease